MATMAQGGRVRLGFLGKSTLIRAQLKSAVAVEADGHRDAALRRAVGTIPEHLLVLLTRRVDS